MYGIAAAAACEEPLQALADCHGRIEAHLVALERLPGEIAVRGLDAATREAARFTLRFFEVAAAEHQRDEEDDLFPLLRARAGELERAEISAVINELSADHHKMDQQWTRLRQRLNAIAQGEPARLGVEDVSGFAWLHRRHIEKESAVVLPFAREVLGAAERSGFGERMAARRSAQV